MFLHLITWLNAVMTRSPFSLGLTKYMATYSELSGHKTAYKLVLRYNFGYLLFHQPLHAGIV
jgi:hypothetical protein